MPALRQEGVKRTVWFLTALSLFWHVLQYPGHRHKHAQSQVLRRPHSLRARESEVDVTRILTVTPDTLAKTETIFWPIVERGRIQFGRQFPAFAEHPAKVLQESLVAMREDAKNGSLARNYAERVVPLVWKACPPLAKVLAGFAQAAEYCLAL